MTNQFWPKAPAEACVHSYDPGFHSRSEEEIVMYFL